MLELIATACAGIFAGAALFISAVEHPVLLEIGGGFAGRFFPRMYGRAAPMQAGLAVVGTICALVLWIGGGGPEWLVGGLLLGLSVPFTLLVIKPVNDRLLDPQLDPDDPDVMRLLRRWGGLHWTRTASSVLAFLVMLRGIGL